MYAFLPESDVVGTGLAVPRTVQHNRVAEILETGSVSDGVDDGRCEGGLRAAEPLFLDIKEPTAW